MLVDHAVPRRLVNASDFAAGTVAAVLGGVRREQRGVLGSRVAGWLGSRATAHRPGRDRHDQQSSGGSDEIAKMGGAGERCVYRVQDANLPRTVRGGWERQRVVRGAIDGRARVRGEAQRGQAAGQERVKAGDAQRSEQRDPEDRADLTGGSGDRGRDTSLWGGHRGDRDVGDRRVEQSPAAAEQATISCA